MNTSSTRRSLAQPSRPLYWTVARTVPTVALTIAPCIHPVMFIFGAFWKCWRARCILYTWTLILPLTGSGSQKQSCVLYTSVYYSGDFTAYNGQYRINNLFTSQYKSINSPAFQSSYLYTSFIRSIYQICLPHTWPVPSTGTISHLCSIHQPLGI